MLKFVLHVLYGFFVGITFWNIPTDLDDRQTQLAAGCMWIIMLQSYVHVFKVCIYVESVSCVAAKVQRRRAVVLADLWLISLLCPEA